MYYNFVTFVLRVTIHTQFCLSLLLSFTFACGVKWCHLCRMFYKNSDNFHEIVRIESNKEKSSIKGPKIVRQVNYWYFYRVTHFKPKGIRISNKIFFNHFLDQNISCHFDILICHQTLNITLLKRYFFLCISHVLTALFDYI